MVKFSRQAAIDALAGQTDSITMEVSGQLSDGRAFMASGAVMAINPWEKTPRQTKLLPGCGREPFYHLA